MNSIKYKDILTNSASNCPSYLFRWRRHFSTGSGAVPHYKMMQKFFKKSKLNIFEWPGNSPDLNPIENVWAIMKKVPKIWLNNQIKPDRGDNSDFLSWWGTAKSLLQLGRFNVHTCCCYAYQFRRRTHKSLKLLEMLFLQYKNKNSLFYKFVEFCEVPQLICTLL